MRHGFIKHYHPCGSSDFGWWTSGWRIPDDKLNTDSITFEHPPAHLMKRFEIKKYTSKFTQEEESSDDSDLEKKMDDIKEFDNERVNLGFHDDTEDGEEWKIEEYKFTWKGMKQKAAKLLKESAYEPEDA